MTAADLIKRLSAFPPDTEVKRLEWACGGGAFDCEYVAQDIDDVLPPGNKHDSTAVVIR